MPDELTPGELALFASIRRAWWSPMAAAQARRGVSAMPAARREQLASLLAEADAARRRMWVGPLTWLLYMSLSSAMIPFLILLGAPHLLESGDEEATRKLEERVKPRVVYFPEPPPPEDEEPPVLDPEKVTGPVRPTAPGGPAGQADGLPVATSTGAIGVISARVDPTAGRSSWLQAFGGGGGGGGDGDGGGGGGIPEGMVYVRGGTFQMGTLPGVGEPEEHPRHPVQLSPYAIDRDETSVGAFNRWCGEAGSRCGWRLEHSASMMADHPVTGVTWHEARAFCRSLGKDLPTEAQWEAAARWDPQTGREGRYPWGNAEPSCSRANSMDCHKARTVPLGTTRGTSPVGARDMAGNAREWVLDWFGSYPAGKKTDPRGPSSGKHRVLRGGSYGGAAEDIRATDRDHAPPDHRSEYEGFRCAVPVEAQPEDLMEAAEEEVEEGGDGGPGMDEGEAA